MIDNLNKKYNKGNYGSLKGCILDTSFVDNISIFDIPYKKIPYKDINELDDIWLSYNLIKLDWTIKRSFLPPNLLLTSAGPNIKKNYLFNIFIQS